MASRVISQIPPGKRVWRTISYWILFDSSSVGDASWCEVVREHDIHGADDLEEIEALIRSTWPHYGKVEIRDWKPFPQTPGTERL